MSTSVTRVSSLAFEINGALVSVVSHANVRRLRPLSVFVTDALWLSLRRSPQLSLIALLGWLPAAATLWVLLERGLRIPSLESFVYDFSLSPQAALLAIVVDPRQALTWSALFAVSYLLGQVLVSGAFTDQLFRLSIDSPRPWYMSLAHSLARLHRALPAVLAIVLMFALAVLTPLGMVAYLVWSGERSWVFLAALTIFLSVPCWILAVWAYGRLALMPTAAVLAPRRTWSFRVSVRATAGHWWAVMTRFVLMALIVAAVTSILATPLAILGLSGSTVLVSVALIGRVVLSLASAALSSASLALVYVDTSASTYYQPATTSHAADTVN